MILLYTGNGKGKTTAALGQMVRVLGRGKTALMIQFIKGPWISGEDDFGKRHDVPSGQFEIRKMGLGFVGILGDALPIEKHKEAARKALDMFLTERKSGTRHLIVLDEINVALSLGLLEIDEVMDAITNYPNDRILVLTGRGAPQALIDAADLVTEMREIKHPFAEGKIARADVEF